MTCRCVGAAGDLIKFCDFQLTMQRPRELADVCRWSALTCLLASAVPTQPYGSSFICLVKELGGATKAMAFRIRPAGAFTFILSGTGP